MNILRALVAAGLLIIVVNGALACGDAWACHDHKYKVSYEKLPCGDPWTCHDHKYKVSYEKLPCGDPLACGHHHKHKVSYDYTK